MSIAGMAGEVLEMYEDLPPEARQAIFGVVRAVHSADMPNERIALAKRALAATAIDKAADAAFRAAIVSKRNRR